MGVKKTLLGADFFPTSILSRRTIKRPILSCLTICCVIIKIRLIYILARLIPLVTIFLFLLTFTSLVCLHIKLNQVPYFVIQILGSRNPKFAPYKLLFKLLHFFSLCLLFWLNLFESFFWCLTNSIRQITLLVNKRLRVDRLFGVWLEDKIFDQILRSTHHNIFNLADLNFWQRRWRLLNFRIFIARNASISMLPRESLSLGSLLGCCAMRIWSTLSGNLEIIWRTYLLLWIILLYWAQITWILISLNYLIGVPVLIPISLHFKIVDLLSKRIPMCFLLRFVCGTNSIRIGLFFVFF